MSLGGSASRAPDVCLVDSFGNRGAYVGVDQKDTIRGVFLIAKCDVVCLLLTAMICLNACSVILYAAKNTAKKW